MLSKADLLPILDDFDPARAEAYLRNLASPAPLIRTSAKSGDGLQDWLRWLREAVGEIRLAINAAPPGQKHHQHTHGPHHTSGHS
jgi:hydrogenase nickel incorporation protein HypB